VTSSIEELQRALGAWPVGDALVVRVVRGQALVERSVIPVDAPA
jgi:hypothetical protein